MIGRILTWIREHEVRIVFTFVILMLIWNRVHHIPFVYHGMDEP